jgi:hypothetical protein
MRSTFTPALGELALHAVRAGEVPGADRDEHRPRLLQPLLDHCAQLALRCVSSRSYSSRVVDARR